MDAKNKNNQKKKRVRDIPIPFFVDKDEKAIIEKKASMADLDRSKYLRKMAVEGYIIKQDLSHINQLIEEINKIGVNINQIAKKCNETDSVQKDDIEDVRKKVEEIWQLLKSTLLNTPSKNQ